MQIDVKHDLEILFHGNKNCAWMDTDEIDHTRKSTITVMSLLSCLGISNKPPTKKRRTRTFPFVICSENHVTWFKVLLFENLGLKIDITLPSNSQADMVRDMLQFLLNLFRKGHIKRAPMWWNHDTWYKFTLTCEKVIDSLKSGEQTFLSWMVCREHG